ncbi:DUF6164 family protein [Gynuella sp.]|uniref:DUF6164 family protein n=1 Tax=Gynuella sp. TaxID=2969146 RepID=UPI003D0CA59D
MARLVFRLNNVPDDEAEEVRDLLRQHEIEFYETSAGRWNISLAAIWLSNNDQFDHARELINHWQQERYERLHEERQAVHKRGFLGNLWLGFRRQPVVFVMYLLAVIIMMALSVVPFWLFSGIQL